MIWSQQIRSYLRLNESLESNIGKTFSKPVSILPLFLDYFSIHVLWVIYRPVRDGSGKSYMIVFLALHFVVSKGVSQGIVRKGKRGGLGREVHLMLAQDGETLNSAVAYPSQN